MTTYENYEIVIVEPADSKANPLLYRYFKLLTAVKNIRFLRWRGEDNCAKIYNYAVSKCTGEYIVFFDKCLEVTCHGWIRELLNYASEPDIAMVSPKCYKDTDEPVYMGGIYNNKSGIKYEKSRNKDFARNVSIPSTYCYMISKNKFIELGGFDEEYENE